MNCARINRPRLGLASAALLLSSGACGGSTVDLATAPGGGSQQSAVCASGATLDGIDVSYYDGQPDWDQIKNSGIAFAFIRVSDGTAHEDSEFSRNWSEARRVGVVRGVYQYFRPAVDPIAQADLLLAKMGTLEPGDLPPVIDVEDDAGLPGSTVAQKVGQWIDHVDAATGRTSIIYTGFYFWRDQVGSSAFADHPLWIAWYDVACPDVPPPWSDWAFHQHTDSGTVPGMPPGVDLDVFNGDAAALADFAQAGIACGDGRCDATESHLGCPGDCRCEEIPVAGRSVDQSETCFIGGGDPQYLHTEDAGYGDTLIWTHTTDSSTVDNYGRWNLEFTQAGRYRLEVFTPAPWSQSTLASYLVHHAGDDASAVVDQSAVDGWQTVGDFDFTAGRDQWVRVDDNTGEPATGNVQLVFDAIRLTPVGAPIDAGRADSSHDAGRSDAIASDAGAETDAANGSDAALAEFDGGSDLQALAAGCDCAATATQRDAAGGLLALLWVARRRRG